jgi:hypothetical protein
MNTINKLTTLSIFLSVMFAMLFVTNTAALACSQVGNDYTGCSGNAVYWFDQCDYKLELYQQCGANQTCQNAQCVDTCNNNQDYTGCSGNAVYWFDSCDNKLELYQQCTSNQVCDNAQCKNVQNITCSNNSQCGSDEIVGSLFCQGNKIYQNYKIYTCNNPGKVTSSCSNSIVGRLQSTCSGNQTCTNGSCTNTCTLNSQQRCVGTSMYWFDSCGNQGNYVGACGNTCTLNSQQRCVGTSMYWFDSCGVQGAYVGSCGTSANLTVTKTVKDITTNSVLAASTYANPSDMVMFMITLKAEVADAQNVYVRDALSSNFTYSNQMTVACTTNNGNTNCNNGYSGDIISGLRLNTINVGQTFTVTYQAKVADSNNFTFGTTTLSDPVTTTSSNVSAIPAAYAPVIVTKAGVLGASTISTGLTNNFWLDSFFLPLLITLIVIWMWKIGMFFGIEKWLDNKKKTRRGYKAEKEFLNRIAGLKK